MNIKNTLKELWVWRKNYIWGWVESIILTLLTLLFCKWINPANPLFIKESFSWPWIASIIIIFQYGFGPGLLSVALIFLSALYSKNTSTMTVLEFQTYVLSGTTLILICALFSSSWIRRLIHAESLNVYTEERLKSLSRSYYTLRLSSDYLEQNIISKPMTLRMALEQLKNLNVEQNEPLSYEVAYSFLQIVSQFCSVAILGIYLCKNKHIQIEPFAEIGSMGSLMHDDPLIKQSMMLNELCFASINQIEDASECTYLVSMPLVNSNHVCIGLLVIKEMPFWSLNEEIIRVLSILVNYFVSEIAIAPEISKFFKAYPECSVDFSKQLFKLVLLKKKMDIESALVGVLVDKRLRQHHIIYHLKTQHRLLDSFWSLELDHEDVLIILMPFTDGAGIHGYLTRINDFFDKELGLARNKQEIKVRSMQVCAHDPLAFMADFLNFIKDKPIAE